MKNRPAITLLFAANIVSGTAQGISMLAIPWYFTHFLQDAGTFGKLYAMITAVSMFWGLYAGVLVDKYDRKKIFMAINVVGAIVLLSIGMTGNMNQHLPLYLVGTVFAATIFIYNIYFPSLYAFAQEIIEPKDYGRITSYIEIQNQLSSLLSGGGAALLLSGISGEENFLRNLIPAWIEVAPWDLWEIFLLDGYCYIAAFLLIAAIRYQTLTERKKETGSIFTRFKKGLAFLNQNRLLFIFGVASMIVFFTILITGYFLNSLYVEKSLHGEASVFAIGDLFFAAGSVLAGIFIRFIFSRKNEVFAVILLAFAAAFIYFVQANFHMNILFFILMLFLGLSNAGSRIMRISYLLRLIPNQIIGRAQGVISFINYFLRFLFLLILSFPFFIENNHISFMILGVCCAIAAIVLMIYYKRLIALKESDIILPE